MATQDMAQIDLHPDVGRTVLVVDDSRMQRRLITARLKKWGYQVVEAGSGFEALDICKSQSPDFVLSDWMMPGMNGLELCAEFRALEREDYGYFVLLTSKSESEEVALGLDAGADDFLTKPVNGDELRARLRAGDRILQIQQELVEKNRLVSETLSKISLLYDSVDRDLLEARKLQQSLVKERYRDFGGSQVSLLLRPSGHVGGDLVGFFPINAQRVGLFSIDVSGHGVSSALMTARLAGYLSGTSPDQNIALVQGEFGIYDALSPAEIARTLNILTLKEMDTEHYFTLAFADVDLVSGKVCMVQAGHPHPAIQRKNGEIEMVGEGGVPIGLIEDASFTEFKLQLEPGDRLFITSDGVTECPNPEDVLLDDDGLADLMRRNVNVHGTAFMEALMWDLQNYAGDSDFPDDVSAVLFEFNSGKRNMD